jgi:DNA repair exonuclease SbcCD ATPase subunit
MKFKLLSIENFLAIGEATLELADRGLLLIQGENRDDTSQNSNGAGKSSIVDALCWCIYGQTARGEAGDSVINRKAGKDTRVTIDITDEEREYKITRHRKFTKKKNVLELTQKVGEEWQDLTLGTDKLTQEKIEQVIGCSYKVFRASIYAAQEDHVDLPALTDKFLKEIVEESAGIDKLQNAHDIAKEALKETKNNLDMVQQRQFSEGLAADDLEFQIAQSESESGVWETALKEKIERYDYRLASEKRNIVALLPEAKAFDTVGVNAEIETIMTRDNKAWFQTQSENTKVGTKISFEYNQVQLQMTEFVKAAKALKVRYVNVEDVVGQPCDSCGKLHEKEDVAPQKENLAKQLKEKMAEIKAHKIVEAEVQEALSVAHRASYDHDLTQIDDSEDKSRLQTLQSALSANELLLTKIRQMKKEMLNWKELLEETTTEKNPHDVITERLQKRRKEAQDKSEIALKEIVVIEQELIVDQAVVAVYSNSGVRAHILDTVTPFLNERTSHYLGQLSDGNLQSTWNTLTKNAKGELKENFHIEVTSLTGGESYKQLSGGEKRKVKLATNMALQDLVSNRASKPISLYIGDEIDHALDVSSLERLMGVLEERAKAHGTVLVISHNELSDWIRESIIAVKENGQTTLE